MVDILANVTTLFDWVLTSMTDLVGWIVDTPLVLAIVCMFFAGFIVSMFVRVFHSV